MIPMTNFVLSPDCQTIELLQIVEILKSQTANAKHVTNCIYTIDVTVSKTI